MHAASTLHQHTAPAHASMHTRPQVLTRAAARERDIGDDASQREGGGHITLRLHSLRCGRKARAAACLHPPATTRRSVPVLSATDTRMQASTALGHVRSWCHQVRPASPAAVRTRAGGEVGQHEGEGADKEAGQLVDDGDLLKDHACTEGQAGDEGLAAYAQRSRLQGAGAGEGGCRRGGLAATTFQTRRRLLTTTGAGTAWAAAAAVEAMQCQPKIAHATVVTAAAPTHRACGRRRGRRRGGCGCGSRPSQTGWGSRRQTACNELVSKC